MENNCRTVYALKKFLSPDKHDITWLNKIAREVLQAFTKGSVLGKYNTSRDKRNSATPFAKAILVLSKYECLDCNKL